MFILTSDYKACMVVCPQLCLLTNAARAGSPSSLVRVCVPFFGVIEFLVPLVHHSDTCGSFIIFVWVHLRSRYVPLIPHHPALILALVSCPDRS